MVLLKNKLINGMKGLKLKKTEVSTKQPSQHCFIYQLYCIAIIAALLAHPLIMDELPPALRLAAGRRREEEKRRLALVKVRCQAPTGDVTKEAEHRRQVVQKREEERLKRRAEAEEVRTQQQESSPDAQIQADSKR